MYIIFNASLHKVSSRYLILLIYLFNLYDIINKKRNFKRGWIYCPEVLY